MEIWVRIDVPVEAPDPRTWIPATEALLADMDGKKPEFQTQVPPNDGPDSDR